MLELRGSHAERNKMEAMAHYGVSALARELGADPGNVSKMMSAGMTPDQIRAKYRSRAALQRRGVGVNGKPTSAPPPTGKKSGDFASFERQAHTLALIKLRKETALAIATELANEQKRGELVPVAWVKSWCEGTVATLREILLHIPTELCDCLAAETNPVEIERSLEAEVLRALEALSEALRSPAEVA
jgi:hypothetical protein